MNCPSVAKLTLVTAVVILCWAYSPTGIHLGLEGYEPGQLALLRFLVASVFMAGVALVSGISLPRVADLPWLCVLGFFGIFLHHVSLNHGQQWVSAGAASVLAQSVPLFSAVVAFFFLKEAVSAWRWGCVLLGLLGVLVVIFGEQGAGAVDWHGALILLAALSWSLYFALQKRYARHYDPLTTVCYTVWSGTLLLSVYWPGLPQAWGRAPLKVNLAVLLLGVFPSALAYLAWAYVLRHTEVSRSAIALYLVPPVAMVMAAAVLGEPVSIKVLLGALIVLSSVAAMGLEGRFRRVV